jgi:hypothetical protein
MLGLENVGVARDRNAKGRVMKRTFTLLLCLLLLTMLSIGLSACATAEKARYARHLTSVVDGGPPANETLSSAFHLDEHNDQPRLAAAASPER